MWPFGRKKRQAADASGDLEVLVNTENPRQANPHADPPRWAQKLIRLFVSKWPSLVPFLLGIVSDSTAKLPTNDKLESAAAIDLLRWKIGDNPTAVALALEAP